MFDKMESILTETLLNLRSHLINGSISTFTGFTQTMKTFPFDSRSYTIIFLRIWKLCDPPNPNPLLFTCSRMRKFYVTTHFSGDLIKPKDYRFRRPPINLQKCTWSTRSWLFLVGKAQFKNYWAGLWKYFKAPPRKLAWNQARRIFERFEASHNLNYFRGDQVGHVFPNKEILLIFLQSTFSTFGNW